jgi:hypothetical protein
VRRQQDRLARLPQAADRLPKLASADRIEADRRLVQEQDRRIVQQAPRDVQSLPHPAGIRLDALVLAALERDELEQLVDARALSPRRHPVDVREVAQVIEAGESAVEPAIAAEDIADTRAHLSCLLRYVETEHAGGPCRRQQQRRQDLDRRRLSCSVRTEQTEQLAVCDRERDPTQGLDLARTAAEDSPPRAIAPFEAVYFDCHSGIGSHDSGLWSRSGT